MTVPSGQSDARNISNMRYLKVRSGGFNATAKSERDIYSDSDTRFRQNVFLERVPTVDYANNPRCSVRKAFEYSSRNLGAAAAIQ